MYNLFNLKFLGFQKENFHFSHGIRSKSKKTFFIQLYCHSCLLRPVYLENSNYISQAVKSSY